MTDNNNSHPSSLIHLPSILDLGYIDPERVETEEDKENYCKSYFGVVKIVI